MKYRFKSLICGSVAVVLLSQTVVISSVKADAPTTSTGKWMSGYPGFEWHMMGLDHGSVAIIDSNSHYVPVEGIHHSNGYTATTRAMINFTSMKKSLGGLD